MTPLREHPGRTIARLPRGLSLLAACGVLALAAIALKAAGMPGTGMAVLGIAALTAGTALAFLGTRCLLANASGIAGVAGTVVDEAIRMRSTLVLLVILIGLVPILPMLVDSGEKPAYRVQFLLNWTLGGTALILGLLTIFLSCGTVSGDIDSGRIHTLLAKPLHRWEYLVGKWLGIVLYDLLLVSIAGAGSFVLVWMLARGLAADDADREAVHRQVMIARRSIPPTPDRPEELAAAIAAAIAQLEHDDTGALADGREATRLRIVQEHEQQWHTVTADMETTFVFRGIGNAPALQLEIEPRATNVDVDFADVSFAVWINDRPWPMRDGEHSVITLPSRARHVFDLPVDMVDKAADLRVRIANRNLVPPGETRPTAITFPPGEGMRLLVHAGGFEWNFIRCLALIWVKLALIASVGVAAGATLDLPLAMLLTLVVYCGAQGNDFLRTALGTYNVIADTAWERLALRTAYVVDSASKYRFYDTFRMLLGFISDGLLALLPSFGSDEAITKLATGILIPGRDVGIRGLLFGVLYPLVFGGIGWLIFDRRDLVRGSS